MAKTNRLVYLIYIRGESNIISISILFIHLFDIDCLIFCSPAPYLPCHTFTYKKSGPIIWWVDEFSSLMLYKAPKDKRNLFSNPDWWSCPSANNLCVVQLSKSTFSSDSTKWLVAFVLWFTLILSNGLTCFDAPLPELFWRRSDLCLTFWKFIFVVQQKRLSSCTSCNKLSLLAEECWTPTFQFFGIYRATNYVKHTLWHGCGWDLLQLQLVAV